MTTNQDVPLPPESPVIQGAMNAMLAMQRRAWEQGVVAQSLLEMDERDWVVLLARDAVVNQSGDGRLGLNGQSHPVADPAANGEPVLFAARVTGEQHLGEAAGRMLSYLLEKAPRTSGGIIYHNDHENRIWVDSIYMLPPFLAVAGHPGEAVRQVVGYRKILMDPGKHLYSHIWDEDRKEFTRKAFWGVGNGWAAAGICRVIAALPDSMEKEKALLAGYVVEILDGCLPFMRADGFFHDVLDDPSTFVETNTGQMLAYSIYRGVSSGWLDEKYLESADRMRAAARSKVDKSGLVQDVCGAPNFNQAGTAAEGQAFFLLMETAYRDFREARNGKDRL